METIHDVSLEDVQKELTRLRNHCQKGKQEKACLFNIIIYTKKSSSTFYFKNLAEKVMQQFPCHIIFIQGDDESPFKQLKIDVSIEKKSHSEEISGDQIFIKVAGSDFQLIPFLITSYLIPDLAVHLIWGEKIGEKNALFFHLQSFANRLIIDSDPTQSLKEFSHSVLYQLKSLKIPFIDMDWVKIEGWREVLTQTFDTSQRLQQLKEAHLIQFTYQISLDEMTSKSQRQALYLQAWLASCLGWKFKKVEKSDKTLSIYYQNLQNLLKIQLLPADPAKAFSCTEGEIVKILVKGKEDYECLLERKGEEQVEVYSCNQYECKLPLHLVMTTLPCNRNFIQEIFFQQISEHYFQLMQLIELISWSQ